MPDRTSAHLTPEHRAAVAGRPALEIHRSARRRRSAQANAQGTTLVVRLPAGLAAAEEERLIDELVGRVTGELRAAAVGGDEALTQRAHALADRYLDGVRATSVRWSGRMARRHGSCTPADGSVRISRALAAHPAYVLDYVLVHELAHLQVGEHSPSFQALVDRFPASDRARGFLEGFAAGELSAGAGAPDRLDQSAG